MALIVNIHKTLQTKMFTECFLLVFFWNFFFSFIASLWKQFWTLYFLRTHTYMLIVHAHAYTHTQTLVWINYFSLWFYFFHFFWLEIEHKLTGKKRTNCTKLEWIKDSWFCFLFVKSWTELEPQSTCCLLKKIIQTLWKFNFVVFLLSVFLKYIYFFDQTCQSLSVSFKPYSTLFWV